MRHHNRESNKKRHKYHTVYPYQDHKHTHTQEAKKHRHRGKEKSTGLCQNHRPKNQDHSPILGKTIIWRKNIQYYSHGSILISRASIKLISFPELRSSTLSQAVISFKDWLTHSTVYKSMRQSHTRDYDSPRQRMLPFQVIVRPLDPWFPNIENNFEN